MKARKTLDVQIFKDLMNEHLTRQDGTANNKFKSGICTALERALLMSGNYHGFNHLYWMEQGHKEWLAAGSPEKWPEKNVFIVGTPDSKYKGQEYARHYS